MREIKFRAWDKTQELMIRHELIALGWSVKKLTEDINFDVMQYTGLKDKNGKEIYEGDVLRFGNERKARNGSYMPYKPAETIGLVEYEGSSFKVFPNEKRLNDGLDGIDLDSCVTAQFMEVIGNIYENPELIK